MPFMDMAIQSVILIDLAIFSFKSNLKYMLK